MGDDSDGLDGVDIDNGLLEDDETLDGRGVDVERDGGAASAEEAAVHIVRDPDDA